jgi:hypothetical protein
MPFRQLLVIVDFAITDKGGSTVYKGLMTQWRQSVDGEPGKS